MSSTSLTNGYVYSLYDTINIWNSNINAGVNVGIGTTAPPEKFSVVGGSIYVERMTNKDSNIDFAYSTLSNVKTLRVDTITSQAPGNILNMNNNNLSNVSTISLNQVTSDGQLITFNGKNLSNITNMYVSSNMYVTKTLFASNLQVTGDFTTLNTLTSNTEQMTVTNAGTGPALIVSQGGNHSVAAFYDSTTMAMYIGGGDSSDAGFVGIGTSAADSRLHLYDSKAIYAHIQATTSDSAQVHMTNTGGETYVGPSSNATIDFLSTAAQPMRIGTSNSEYIRIAISGSVGIGSTDPKYPLDIKGKTRVQDAMYLTTNNMNTIFYSNGGRTFSSGNHSIGLTMAWVNAQSDNSLAFRVKVKCHVATPAGSVAYRKFETIVTPNNNSGNSQPNQIIATEIADTNNSDFSQLTHTVTRAGASSVTLSVGWTTTVSSYVGNIQVEVFANTALGDFTFTPLQA
jgi:hypothetical protein